jgi:hypothetical protein
MVLTVWIESFYQSMKEISNKIKSCACACLGKNMMAHVMASFLNVDRSRPLAFDRLKSRIGSKAASCDKPTKICALPSLPYPIAI